MEESDKTRELMELFREVMILWRQSMSKVFEDTGLTAQQGMVIGVLSRLGNMKISELSTILKLSNSTVSGIIDRLEKQGIVDRIRSKEDKRVVNVCISQKFHEMHQEFHKKAEENVRNIMNKGTPEDINKIIEGLEVLKKLLSD